MKTATLGHEKGICEVTRRTLAVSCLPPVNTPGLNRKGGAVNHREAGFSTILIVLMTAVVLIGVLTTNVTLTLNQRQNTSNERASYTAVLASESGQETFRARAAATPFPAGTPACSGLLAASCYQSAYTANLNTYLSSLGAIPVPGGTVTLTASSVTVSSQGDLTSVDILATSTIGQDAARIVRSYSAQRFSLNFPHVPAAVTSYPGVNLGGNATVGGLSLNNPGNTGTIPNYMTVQNNASTSLSPGSTVTVTVPPQNLRQLGQLQIGHYIKLPTTQIGGLPGADATFKVMSTAGDQLTLQAVQVPSVVSTLTNGPVSLTRVLNGISSTLGTQLTVSATETFYPGDQISVTVAGVTYTTTVTAVNGTAITTSGWPAGAPTVFPEGTAITKSTNAIVTAGAYSGNNKQPSAADAGAVLSGPAGNTLLSPPTNDALFQQVLGMTPTALKAGSTVLDPTTFTGKVSGLTWLNTDASQSINLNITKLNGSGMLVVDGDLTINNNGTGACDFKGILFVRGNLRMQGNIQICGALVVEGAILTSNGLNATGLDSTDTNVSGTGQKVQYSPADILDAIGGAGPYTFGAARNWRQQ